MGEQIASPKARAAQRKRRATIVLRYSFGVLTLSVALTLTGLTAALWHIAWWIGIVFLAMAVISLGIVIAALATLGPRESPEDREQQRRYWQEMLRQAQTQTQSGTDDQKR
jgi:uncharacterized membrane protein YcjF (UPF0283 family)